MRTTRGLRAALLLGLLLALAAPLVASGAPPEYALIYGTLWGPDNRPVYGVHMRLRRAREKKMRWESMSDHRGEFAFRVPVGPGDYVLVPDVKRARNQPAPETRVHVEADERVDVSVHLSE
ncbi:MAG: hypothetical protein P4M01_03405 [Acidobacteriota bacterium]|nr:hypothetical protein [Acidobacteriota bacterium]